MLADSNVLIYAIRNTALADWLIAEMPAVSAISMVETLGYHRIKPEEKELLEEIFETLTVLYPTPHTFQLAITLRQQRKMSLGDALIAATALEYDLTLATHNTADFADIADLQLFDPLET